MHCELIDLEISNDIKTVTSPAKHDAESRETKTESIAVMKSQV